VIYDDWPDEDGWSERDENLFSRAAEARKRDWYVPYQDLKKGYRTTGIQEDSGSAITLLHPRTVMQCTHCGKWKRFPHREDAHSFLMDGQCDCQKEPTNG